MSIRGIGKTKFMPENLDEDSVGQYRFIIIGSYENILKEEFDTKGKITIENIDFDGREMVGGIGNIEGDLRLVNTQFINHYIKGIRLLGGAAILNSNKISIISEDDLMFINNKNESIYKAPWPDTDGTNGGAIYNTSGIEENVRMKFLLGQESVDEVRKYRIPTIETNVQGRIVLEDNVAEVGGGIWNDGDISINSEDDIIFEKNVGESAGGAIYSTIIGADIERINLEKPEKRIINFDIESKNNIYFNDNKSEQSTLFNGAEENTEDSVIRENKYINMTIKAKRDIEFNGLVIDENDEATGAAILNQGYYYKYLNDDGSVKDIEKAKTNLGVKAGRDLIFRNNYGDSLAGAIQNNVWLLFREGASLEDREDYDMNLESGRNIEFIENKSRYNAAGLTNNSVNGVNVKAVKDINFIRNNSIGFNAGGIDNSRVYNSQIPVLMRIVSEEGEINFIENKNTESTDTSGAINNAGELILDGYKDINIRGNMGGERGTAAIRNELGAGYSLADGLFDVLIRSRMGNINIQDNKSDSNSEGSIISNAGNMDIEAKNSVNISHNSLKKGSIIFNVPHGKEVVRTNIRAKEGKIDFISNYIGDENNLETLEVDGGIFSNKNRVLGTNEGLSSINLNSMGDISIINNTNLNGGLIDIQYENEFDKSYEDLLVPIDANDFKNIGFKSRDGKVYMVGNQTNEKTASFNSQSLAKFVGYSSGEINRFMEDNFKNIWLNDRSLFTNDFENNKVDFEKLKYIDVDFKNFLFMLNGLGYKTDDRYKFAKNSIKYKIDGEDEKITKEFRENMNDTLIIRADESLDTGALLTGAESFEEITKLRDGIDYKGIRKLKAELKTNGAKKDGYYVKAWKLNKNLITGEPEEIIISRLEMKDKILNPINHLLEELSKFETDEEFSLGLIDILENSTDEVVKNMPKYDGGLIVSPIWELGEEPQDKVIVTFDANGGKLGGENSRQVEIVKGSLVSKLGEDPIRDGYKFKGWSEIKDSFFEFDFSTSIDEDKILYGIWEKETRPISKVTVKFNADGGKFSDDSTVKYKTIDKGTRVEKISDSPRRSGYTFRGWKKAGASRNFDFDTLIDEDITLYADWDRDSGGGKEKPDPDKSKPEPEKEKEKEKDRRGREIGKIIEPKIEFELNTVDHLGYIKGYEDNTVRPNGKLTREEAAMVFYRVMDRDFREDIKTKSHSFTDVETGRWSERAIATLANAEMISGYGDKSFKPTKAITRAELSSMIAKLTDTIVLHTEFQDIIEHWAEDYINTAQNKGWISGYEDGSFRPDDYISRSEFATVLNSILNRKVKEEDVLSNIKTFKDLEKNTWYYDILVEAINGHKYEVIDGREKWIELDNREFE